MSDAQNETQDEAHEGFIKTPKQLVAVVVLAFVVPVIVIILLASFVARDTRPAAGSNLMSAEAIATRLQAVGRVEVKDVSDAGVPRTGEQVFAAVCTACHTAGVAGAPKFGDEAAWAPRIKTGYEALLTSALKGKNAMPAQGGGETSDYEIGLAVVYMANKGGAKFEEPKPPAAAASEPAK
jgi:cytochrome c5